MLTGRISAKAHPLSNKSRHPQRDKSKETKNNGTKPMTKRMAKIEEKANTLLTIQRQQDAEALLQKTTTEIETARNKLKEINTAIRIADERRRELSQQLRDKTLNLHILKEDINYLQYESESVSS